MELLRQMEANGIKPGMISFNSAIDACARVRKKMGSAGGSFVPERKFPTIRQWLLCHKLKILLPKYALSLIGFDLASLLGGARCAGHSTSGISELYGFL